MVPQPTEALPQPAEAAAGARPWAMAAARATPNAWTKLFPETARELAGSLQRWKSKFPDTAVVSHGRMIQPAGAVGASQSAQALRTAAQSSAGVTDTDQSVLTSGNSSQPAAAVAGAQQSVLGGWVKRFPKKEPLFSRTPRAIPGRSPRSAESVGVEQPAQAPGTDSQSAAGFASAEQSAQVTGVASQPAAAAQAEPDNGRRFPWQLQRPYRAVRSHPPGPLDRLRTRTVLQIRSPQDSRRTGDEDERNVGRGWQRNK